MLMLANYYHNYTCLLVSFPKQAGLVSTRMKKPVLDLNEARDYGGFGMAVASAGPYANNLHLTPDR